MEHKSCAVWPDYREVYLLLKDDDLDLETFLFRD